MRRAFLGAVIVLAAAFLVLPATTVANGDCAGIEDGGVYVNPEKCVPGNGEGPRGIDYPPLP